MKLSSQMICFCIKNAKKYNIMEEIYLNNVENGLKFCIKCFKWYEKNVFLPKSGMCKSCKSQNDRLWRINNIERKKYNDGMYGLKKDRKYLSYERDSKLRNVKFNLSFEEFILFWQKPCFYCGDKIETIGLDRVDNNKGYVLDNVVPCCFACNKMKSNLSQSDWFIHILKILNNLE